MVVSVVVRARGARPPGSCVSAAAKFPGGFTGLLSVTVTKR